MILNFFLKNLRYIVVVLSVLCQSFAFLFMKLASKELSILGFNIENILLSYYIWIVLFFIALQTYLWQISLRKLPLTKAYVFTILVHPLLLSYSVLIFNENISTNNVLGTVLIITGLVMYSKFQYE